MSVYEHPADKMGKPGQTQLERPSAREAGGGMALMRRGCRQARR